MLFHTFTFLPFYILFIACYYSFSNPKFRVGVLLFFSNVFYGWWNWKLLGLIWLTIGLDFIISKKIYRANTKKEKFRFLLVTLIVNFSLLGFFKYWNFFMGSFHSIGLVAADRFVVENLILPVGISFYTFQSVSYSLDVYRERLKPVDSIIDYAAYVSFFPQLVAGPIERIESLLPQIVRFNKFDFDHFISGFYLFSQGLFRKALGDILSDLSDPTFKMFPMQLRKILYSPFFILHFKSTLIFLDTVKWREDLQGRLELNLCSILMRLIFLLRFKNFGEGGIYLLAHG
jgi:alginate O-acetyltransferase complex protein AlgI